RVKILVGRVHLLRRRAHGVERFLLLLLGLGQLRFPRAGLLRALLERLRRLLHGRVGLLLQGLGGLLPVGQRALRNLLVPHGIAHDLVHFLGHLFQGGLVGALAGLHVLDVFAGFFLGEALLVVGDGLRFIDLPLFIANALVELL